MQKAVPPSVTEIAKMIRENAEPGRVSQVIALREARKLQRRWAKASKLRNFNDLPSARQPVLNGTGVLLHTNLGRAPLGRPVLERINRVLAGYSNLEIDLQSGDRGGRTKYLDALFATLVATYKPVWVNNNAAAILLALNTLKKTTGLTRMIISRGELVEIGGGFRVPEIMAEAGFEIIEIGTTNKTRLDDYARSLKKSPGVICSVHPSNFVIEGYAERVSPHDLIKLGRKHRVPVVYDAGTLTGEELRRLPKGYSCVTVSTDKTLGSVQGGIIIAEPKLQTEILKNPLYRAFRLGKVSLTALEGAFEAHAEKTDRKLIPLSEMMNTPVTVLEKRAENVMQLELKNFDLTTVKCLGSIGGGALPGETRSSIGVAITPRLPKTGSPQKIANMLRRGTPSVLTSIVDSKATVQLLTVFDWQIEELKKALRLLDKRFET